MHPLSGRKQLPEHVIARAYGQRGNMTVDERFNEQVEIVPGGCHLWRGSINGMGYGQLKIDGNVVLAHVCADNRAKGPIADGLERDHTCRTKPCVNPAHIDRVTHAENLRRHFQALGFKVRTSLTEAEESSIRTDHSNGESIRALATRAGCSCRTIRLVLGEVAA
jgi:hypothetical protein